MTRVVDSDKGSRLLFLGPIEVPLLIPDATVLSYLILVLHGKHRIARLPLSMRTTAFDTDKMRGPSNHGRNMFYPP